MNIDSSGTNTASKVRSILVELARREKDEAADDAAATPCCSPTPATVLEARTVAALLGAAADQLLAES
ncbi:hypothetical protein DDE18_08060 [Nocardioides gansuensis]|uniref:Uncharacterized protein n=1 Tax=Nocardioides gansuensis TaxID=2138300 RepID=A0A2T8FC04_9ACTN|nr:hypothetical protein [Nocardioides gansuensis]PVG83244.1 hypothetical protein DDE18_08060 [Nocardioides gansuensis]